MKWFFMLVAQLQNKEGFYIYKLLFLKKIQIEVYKVQTSYKKQTGKVIILVYVSVSPFAFFVF